MDPSPNRNGFFERLTALLLREPEDREQLLALLHSAFERNLLDADALTIIEGALAVSDMPVRDVMIPRAQMDVIEIDEAITSILEKIKKTGHSRFPVTGNDRDDIIGILHAKDLLRVITGDEESVRDMLRPAVFIPQSKRLNVLLREFRVSRNHMAIVVDEYGGAAGLVTIEDVLEQIVGDIEDEYDFDEAADNIRLDQAGRYRVKATTEMDDFNTAFGTDFSRDEFETVGGMVIHHLGRLPKRGEVLNIGDLRLQVLRADSRRVHTLLVDRLHAPGLAE
ncbi:MAG: CBS domain-containing protein [Rhodocyclaceae bacterium]|nr:CBS domain-containing protein [Rhodocyclaceae bacterium]MBX3669030.1 CBS domain-containing protein [Rhodocyclaceae bacterium]